MLLGNEVSTRYNKQFYLYMCVRVAIQHISSVDVAQLAAAAAVRRIALSLEAKIGRRSPRCCCDYVDAEA